MTVQYLRGNLFKIQTEAIVIPVNTVGAMGKGVALECARRYPELQAYYKAMCRQNRLRIGNCLTWRKVVPWIICVPTKTHWKLPSQPQYIHLACATLRSEAIAYNIEEMALPWLGCGEGGLTKDEVRPIFEAMLGPAERTLFTVVELGGGG